MKRFLSLILAVTLVASLFTVNVMAASTAHTVTISADKTTGLKAGDTVTIEIKVDNTEKLSSFGYYLTYASSAFLADQEKVSRVEKCIDKTWLDDIKNPDGDWAYYLGNPTYSVAKAGEINFAWAGSAGVEAEYAKDNRLVGRFFLQISESAVDGEYTFALTGSSLDLGENTEADLACAPITVTVGEEKKDPAIDEVRGAENTGIAVKEEVGDFKYDNAYAVEVDLTADVKGDVVGVEFVPAFMSGSIDDIWKFAAETTTYSSTWLGEGGATLKAALINIPIELLNETFTIKARAFVKNGADKTYFGTIVEQEVTYTVD